MDLQQFNSIATERSGVRFATSVEFRLLKDFVLKFTSPSSETSTQAVTRVASHLRWWAESRGYFNRKPDAFNFLASLQSALASGVLQLPESVINQVGVFNTFKLNSFEADRFYINQETYAAKQGVNLFEFPNYVGIYKLYNQNLTQTEQIALGKITAIVGDVLITMSNYPSQELLKQTWTYRKYKIDGQNYNPDFVSSLLATNSSLAKCLELEGIQNQWQGSLPASIKAFTQNLQFRSQEIEFTWQNNDYVESVMANTTEVNNVINAKSKSKVSPDLKPAQADNNVASKTQIKNGDNAKQEDKPNLISETNESSSVQNTPTIQTQNEPKSMVKSVVIDGKLTILSLLITSEGNQFYCQIHKASSDYQNNINLICRLMNKLSSLGTPWSEIIPEVMEETIFSPELGVAVTNFLQENLS